MKLWIWLIIGTAIAIAIICALGFCIAYRQRCYSNSRFDNVYPPIQTIPSPIPSIAPFRLNGNVPPPVSQRISYQEPAADNGDVIVARPKRHSYQEAPPSSPPQPNLQTQTLNRNRESAFMPRLVSKRLWCLCAMLQATCDLAEFRKGTRAV